MPAPVAQAVSGQRHVPAGRAEGRPDHKRRAGSFPFPWRSATGSAAGSGTVPVAFASRPIAASPLKGAKPARCVRAGELQRPRIAGSRRWSTSERRNALSRDSGSPAIAARQFGQGRAGEPVGERARVVDRAASSIRPTTRSIRSPRPRPERSPAGADQPQRLVSRRRRRGAQQVDQHQGRLALDDVAAEVLAVRLRAVGQVLDVVADLEHRADEEPEAGDRIEVGPPAGAQQRPDAARMDGSSTSRSCRARASGSRRRRARSRPRSRQLELERMALDRSPGQVVELRQQVEREPGAECRGVDRGAARAPPRPSASPALSARGMPWRTCSASAPRRRRASSQMSSWTRNALCRSSIATAAASASSLRPPWARQVARQSAGRMPLPGRSG